MLLDTHVALWVYTGDTARLSVGAVAALSSETLAVSPAVEMELASLHEVGRITDTPAMILSMLGVSVGVAVAQIGFGPVCSAAVDITWTRDPFDRLIAAHAIVAGLPLLTKDRAMLDNLDLAFWDEPTRR